MFGLGAKRRGIVRRIQRNAGSESFVHSNPYPPRATDTASPCLQGHRSTPGSNRAPGVRRVRQGR
jgi:hypothetical protein